MPPIIMMSDWSKLPDIFFPKVSLTEVKQQAYGIHLLAITPSLTRFDTAIRLCPRKT